MFFSSNIGDPVLFWIFRFLLLLIFIFCGYGMSFKKEENFNKYAVSAIIPYAIIEGLRWMRGRDYYHYYQDLVTNLEGAFCTPEPELLYRIWINIFYKTGFPYYFAFILYSALLLTAFIFVIKVYRKSAIIALPVFFIMFSLTAENLIRQYLAVCFLLFALGFYLRENKKYTYIMLAIVPFIHITGIFGIILFLLFTKTKINLKSPIILIGIYLFFYFLWNPSYFSYITNTISLINIGFSRDHYIQNADYWFSGETTVGSNEQSFISKLSQFTLYIIVIYKGFEYQKLNQKFKVVFYFSYISILIITIGNNIEIYRRFYNWLGFSIPIILGMIFMYNPNINKRIRLIMFLLIIIQYGYCGFISTVKLPLETGYGFIWDK